MSIELDKKIPVKFIITTKNGTRVYSPGEILVTKTRIEFLKSPFALKDDIKAMTGSRWHGYDDPPRKIWTVENSPGNWFSIQVMFGENPYKWFDRPLETHEYDRPLMEHQKHMSDAGLTYHYQIFGAEMGCIDGNAIVCVHRSGGSKRLSLRELCYKFHGGRSYNGYSWNPSINTYIQGFRGNKIGLTQIKDILLKGTQLVVKLTTTNHSLILTSDHEVCVGAFRWGKFQRVDSLVPGDKLMVTVPKGFGISTKVKQIPPKQIQKVCKQGNLFALDKRPINSGYIIVTGVPHHPRANTTNCVFEHILVMEEYLGRYLKQNEEIHHINNQKWDNKITNLLLCTSRASHKAKHLNFGCGQFIFEEVISVEDAGETDVYDVMCEGPYHNFVANEIVVENCGKTLSAIEVMERSGVKDWVWIGPRSALMAVERELKKWEISDDVNMEISTYEGLTKRMKNWTDGDTPPQGVIFDESSRLKSPQSQRSQAAQALTDGIREEYGNDGYVILMSGTPAPRSPMDWWKPSQICYPGYLREGNVNAFRIRMGICTKQENTITGQTFLQHVTWRDDESKCDICGGYDLSVSREDDVDYCEEDGHKFTKSKNEVAYLYERLKGLAIIKHKKDCLDLPDKRYRIIRCEVTPALKRVAKTLLNAAPSTITGLTWLRELSDGFQYRTKEIGTQECSVCEGSGTTEYWLDPDDSEKAFTMTEMLDPEYVATLNKAQLACMACTGSGEVPKYERTVKTIPCPKDEALVNLLDENEEQGRVVIFAGFTGSIDKIVELCKREKWAVVRVDGRGWITYDTEGNCVTCKPLDYWADLESNSRVAFVANPKAGGMGLTLTEARMAIYYSNSYESESRVQSEDRIHRQGADRNVGVEIVDLIHLPTDEAVLERLKENRALELMSMGDIEANLK